LLESFLTALGVILPLTLFLLCGTGLKKLGFMSEEFISGANKLIFHVFLPMSLFRSTRSSELDIAGNGLMVLFCCICVLLTFLIYIPVAKRMEPLDSRRSVMVQASFRGNLAIFGFPVLSLMYGSDQLGPVAVLLAFVIPELNILAVLCFEIFSDKKASLRHALMRVAKNPLIISIVVGIIFNLLSIPVPSPVMKTVDALAEVTTPLAFLILGAGFSFSSAKANRKAITVSLLGKLFILPVLALSMGILLGLRGPMLAACAVLFGAPVAVSSVPMTSQMGGDEELAGEMVVVSTMLGVFTMFMWIFLMSCLNLL